MPCEKGVLNASTKVTYNIGDDDICDVHSQNRPAYALEQV